MNMQRPLSALIFLLITTLVLGPAALWASEQHGMLGEASNQALIAAISGEHLTVQSSAGSKTLYFRDSVDVGDQIATGGGTVAEVLIGRRAVVKLRPNTTVKLTTLSPEQTTIQVTRGIVRVAVSATALGEQGTMVIQMPEGQVLTRGGIVRVIVNAPVGSVEYTPVGEAKPYLTSTAPNTTVAALDTRGDIIQVKEGAAEITGMGAGDEIFKVQASQSVTLQAGQAGSIAALLPPGDMRVEVLASADHSNTPQQGREHLVELQVDQATQLARLLTGSDEPAENSIEKDNVQNAIIGSTGGGTVSKPPTTTPTFVATLFGDGAASNSPTQTPINSTGSGFGGGNNSGFNFSVEGDGVSVMVNGEKALLVFTRKDAILPDDSRSLIKSQFTVEKELVLVGGKQHVNDDGTVEAYHGGRAPTETLIVRGAAPAKAGEKITNLASSNTDGSGVFPTDRFPKTGANPSEDIVKANSTFVVQTRSSEMPSKPFFDQKIKEFVTEIKKSVTKINESKSEIVDSASKDRINFFLEDIEGIDLFVEERRESLDEPNSSVETSFVEVKEYVKSKVEFAQDLDNPKFGQTINDSLEDIGNSVDNMLVNEPNVFSQVGGTLGQFSNDPTPSPDSIAIDGITRQNTSSDVVKSFVDGAITATGSNVELTGGVTLDQETQATIGTTEATDNYFSDSNHNIPDAELFDGSLLAVIDGSNVVTTAVTVNNRLLGVYDGSTIDTTGDGKALLSVLDAKLTSPAGEKIPLIDIDAASHFETVIKNDGLKRSIKTTAGSKPNITVTSAVVTRSTIPLDDALLEASAPLLALTNAMMTTTSHFADLAGNQAQSILLNDALVALNTSQLIIENGHLLNLNDSTAAVNGYLFSLNGGSTLKIEDGTLFSLNNGSVLNLNANAFGVFGAGNNTLSISNSLCAQGPCGTLVNIDNTQFTLNGSELQVAGITQDVVLPDGFNVFAAAQDAQPDLDIAPDAALFQVDGSTLTINGTDVVVNP